MRGAPRRAPRWLDRKLGRSMTRPMLNSRSSRLNRYVKSFFRSLGASWTLYANADRRPSWRRKTRPRNSEIGTRNTGRSRSCARRTISCRNSAPGRAAASRERRFDSSRGLRARRNSSTGSPLPSSSPAMWRSLRAARRSASSPRGVSARARRRSTLPQRLEPPRGHAVGEARERQALAEQQPVDQAVVEQRPVAQHVDDRAALRETLELRDAARVDVHVTGEAARAT